MDEEPSTCGWCTAPRKPGDPYYCSEAHRRLDQEAIERHCQEQEEEQRKMIRAAS